jgi:RNA polymerase sigma-70 factor (ECF subfamily)
MRGCLSASDPKRFASLGAFHESPSPFGDPLAKDERTMTTAIYELEDETTSLEYLVEAAQAGDRDAFGELATRFEPMVYAIAVRRLGNHSEAQELCQEVLVKAMQKLEQLKVPAAFGGWLRSITVRMAINRQVRRAPMIATEPQALDASCVESVTPLDTVLANERATQVRGGLARLGDLDRHTLEAFYVRGESLSQMSESFAAPIGTIKRRLHVARKRLARQLETAAAV